MFTDRTAAAEAPAVSEALRALCGNLGCNDSFCLHYHNCVVTYLLIVIIYNEDYLFMLVAICDMYTIKTSTEKYILHNNTVSNHKSHR